MANISPEIRTAPPQPIPGPSTPTPLLRPPWSKDLSCLYETATNLWTILPKVVTTCQGQAAAVEFQSCHSKNPLGTL